MARAVKEWIGKHDDAMPPKLCKLRIVERQGGKCALTGLPFTLKAKPQFDHITPLWLGGKNCESNLQAIHKDPHKAKTSAEASVRAKVNATRATNLGVTPPKAPIPSRAKPEKASKDKLPIPGRINIFTGEPVR